MDINSNIKVVETATVNKVSEGQDSSGVLIDTQEPLQIRSLGFTTEDIPIVDIQYLKGFMYFMFPTDLDRPHVARTPEGDFLLDGWDIKIDAEEKGDITIASDVETFNIHSEMDLCLRAAASRIKPRGGHATYMENCLVVKFLLNMLLSTNENLKLLGHGGKRNDGGLPDNREEDVRSVMCHRLDKDRSTINTYMTHIEYLSENATWYFIEQGAIKDFFVKKQGKKRELINKLIGQNVGDEVKVQQISEFMIHEYAEYEKERKEGKNKTKKTGTQQTKISLNKEQKQISQKNEEPTDETDEMGSELNNNHDDEELVEGKGNTVPGQDEEKISLPKIKREVLDASTRLSEKINKTDDLDSIEECILEELTKLMEALSYIGSLKSQKKAA